MLGGLPAAGCRAELISDARAHAPPPHLRHADMHLPYLVMGYANRRAVPLISTVHYPWHNAFSLGTFTIDHVMHDSGGF
ncbi:unnamed protein product [Colias eurytheme]|nr:unnamed protein product [Colias eurytheme]